MADEETLIPPVADHLAALESSLPDSVPLARKGTEFFIPVLDRTMKTCANCVAGRAHGAADFATRRLLVQCVNDLLVGFFLMRHGYFQQGFGAVRPVTDALRLVDLFMAEPAKAELWAEGGEKNWHRLMGEASKIKNELDAKPFFKFLSAVGSHPTWHSGKLMSARIGQCGDHPKVAVVFGGAQQDPLFAEGFILGSLNCYLLCGLVQNQMMKVFADRMSEQDAAALMKDQIEHLRGYLCYLKKESGYKVPTVDELLVAVEKSWEAFSKSQG